MHKERLPQWAWLLLGLFTVAVATNALYLAVLGPLGLPERYLVAVLIANMSLVVIYLGLWYDETRAAYWEHSRAAMVGDVLFVLLAALTMSGLAIAVGLEYDLPSVALDFLAMVVGFASAWGLFYFRNTDLYDFGS